MNEAELKRNGALSDFVVRDLNANPVLPYPDATFDVVTNAVSVDYLTRCGSARRPCPCPSPTAPSQAPSAAEPRRRLPAAPTKRRPPRGKCARGCGD